MAIDPDGVTVNYAYDNLKRQVASTTLRGGASGVTLTTVLDASAASWPHPAHWDERQHHHARPIAIRRFGPGHLETNALGGVTTHANVLVNNQVYRHQCVSRRRDAHRSLLQRRTTPERLRHRRRPSPIPIRCRAGCGIWRAFTLQIKLDANGGTNEWIKTYTDGAGQPYKTVYPDAGGDNPFAISYFNVSGQVTNQVDPDLVATLLAYNGKGEQVLAAVDMDRNGTIDLGGSDRITFTTNDVTSDHGANVLRTRVYVWTRLTMLRPT